MSSQGSYMSVDMVVASRHKDYVPEISTDMVFMP